MFSGFAAFGNAGPMSLPPQPSKPANNNPASTSSSAAGASAASAKLPTSFGDVGGLNINLDDLSLSGRNPVKKSVPMNAMQSTSKG